MRNVIALHYDQCGGHADTVIGAQGLVTLIVDIEVMNSVLVLHIPCRGAPVGEPSERCNHRTLSGNVLRISGCKLCTCFWLPYPYPSVLPPVDPWLHVP